MNFWHMQLHPDNSNLGQEKDILKKTSLIVIGIWDKPDEDKNASLSSRWTSEI